MIPRAATGYRDKVGDTTRGDRLPRRTGAHDPRSGQGGRHIIVIVINNIITPFVFFGDDLGSDPVLYYIHVLLVHARRIGSSRSFGAGVRAENASSR